MIPIKIQCGCGQRYAFEVEPVNGQMAGAVACPVCGVDGTEAANVLIAQALGRNPSPVLTSSPAPSTPPSIAPGLKLSATTPPAVPPPLPPQPGRYAPPVAPDKRRKDITKLEWYEHAWAGLPLGLIILGGAIGGAIGGGAWVVNKTMFKSIDHPVWRWVVTGMISLAAVFVWLLILLFIKTTILNR